MTAKTFLDVYSDVLYTGKLVSPRGMQVMEVENYQFTMAPYERFTSFKARKLNLDYLKWEFLWYLRGDPYDEQIVEGAQMWTDIQQEDGRFFSNYGQYWFGQQGGFKWVIDELMHDKDSRRAVIPMLNESHLFLDNKDIVCTESISFRIRHNQLSMSVNMRSQDLIWGMTNDVACFSFLQEMVCVALRGMSYPDLVLGNYNHKLDSLHVYERHFDTLRELVDHGSAGHYDIPCPVIETPIEVYALINYAEKLTNDNFSMALEALKQSAFFNWLRENKYGSDLEL